jgi:hypothetical protein
MKAALIAPCGMNCALCIAYLREKRRCPGCPGREKKCAIRNCEHYTKARRYCFLCDQYPCSRIKRLDERYRKRYGMSMIENLKFIREKGIRKFLRNERERWIRGGKTFCVHTREYFPGERS